MGKKARQGEKSQSKLQQYPDKAIRRPLSTISKSRLKPLLWPAGLFLVIVIVIWATYPDEHEQSPPEYLPSDQIPMLSSLSVADWEAQSLRGALSYVEQSEDGKHRRIQPQTHFATVDCKSRLIIIPARDRIKELAGTDREVLPSLPPEVRERLESIPDLIHAAEAYVANASQILEEVGAARRSGQELSQDEVARRRRQIVAQGKQGLQLLSLVIEIAEARAIAEHWGDQEAIDEAVAKMTDSLITDAEGNPVTLNVRAFGEFLSEEVRFTTGYAIEDALLAEIQGTVRYRMWAWLRNQASRVSIENYYDAGAFERPKRPRIAFSMTPEEQARVERGYNTAKDAARLIRNLRNKKSSLRAELRALWKTLRSELRSLDDLPTDDLLRDLRGSLVKAIDLATPAADASQKKELQDLKAFVTQEWNDDLQTMSTAFDELREPTSPEEFISMYMAFTGKLQSALELAVTYPQKVDKNITRLQVLTKVLGDMATTESKAMLEKLAQEGLPETREKLTKLTDGLLADYADLAGEVLGSLYGRPLRERLLEMADGLDASGELPPVPAVDFDDIIPGTIDLSKTPVDRGGKLTIRAELFTINEDGEEVVQQSAEQSFRITPYSFTQALFAMIWESLWRRMFVATGVVLVVALSIWATLPDETKKKILEYLYGGLKRRNTGAEAERESNTNSE